MPDEQHHNNTGDGNLMAIFAYLGIFIIVPFLTDSKNNPFVKFHLKQGLALLVFGVVDRRHHQCIAISGKGTPARWTLRAQLQILTTATLG